MSAKKNIIEVCQRLHKKNFLAGTDGNVSIFQKKDLILITPSGVSKNFLKVSDICSMTLKGRVVQGKPSSEKAMHLKIYREQKKARAVIHAHPPYAVSLSLSRPQWKTLPLLLPETVIDLGHVPFVPYALPGTEEMANTLSPFLKKSCALILSHHGAVTWGKDLEAAYLRMERLEHSAQMIYLSEALGGGKPLKKKDLSQLLKKAAFLHS